MGNHTFAIAVFAFTILLSAIGIYIYRKISKAKTKKEKEDVAKQGLEGSNLIGEEADENEEQKSKPGEEQASDSIKIADRIDMKQRAQIFYLKKSEWDQDDRVYKTEKAKRARKDNNECFKLKIGN